MNYFDKQMGEAKNNYNYFFMKLIISLFKIVLRITIGLFISSILDCIFIYIITLLFVIYSVVQIIFTYRYYLDIINDIKNTIGCDLIFEIDFRNISYDIFKGVLKYGK